MTKIRVTHDREGRLAAPRLEMFSELEPLALIARADVAIERRGRLAEGLKHQPPDG